MASFTRFGGDKRRELAIVALPEDQIAVSMLICRNHLAPLGLKPTRLAVNRSLRNCMLRNLSGLAKCLQTADCGLRNASS